MKWRLVFCLLICASIAFAQQTNKRTNKIEIANTVLDSFDITVENDINTKDIVGAAYLVYQNGKLIRMKAFGEADMNSHRPMQTNNIFRLASMTKPIASLALLLLQEDGLINMNDRLDQYLPAFTNQLVVDKIDTINGAAVLITHPAKKPILLRHLLTHAAGFASQYGGNLGIVSRHFYQSLCP